MADTKLTGLTELSVPALDDWLYWVDKSDTTDDAAGSSRKASITRGLGFLNHICQGRLTLATGDPHPTADQTAKTTIYFTGFNGQVVSLYDGTRWRLYTFTEVSLALGTLTDAKNYDVFLYDNAGTLTLEFSSAWTNDTTRADALTMQDEVWVKSGATTRRYIGTFRTTATTTTEDSANRRLVWNMQNRVPKHLRYVDATASWTYTTDTFRRGNGVSAPNGEVQIVCGLAGASMVRVHSSGFASNSGSGVSMYNGIGEDSDTALAAETINDRGLEGSTNNLATIKSTLIKMAPLGWHYYTWLEKSQATGTTTFRGTGTNNSYGLAGSYEC